MKIFLVTYFFLLSISLFAQQDDTISVLKYEIEKDVLNLPVSNSIDRKTYSGIQQESILKTSLPVAVITAEEIENSGVSSIAEALRLVPGFVVSQKTNGVFQAVSTGNTYSPDNVAAYDITSSFDLVMIDGVPYRELYNAKMYWEALPIGVVDIEQIEVFYGPVSYMDNQVGNSCAINIVTRKMHDLNLHALASTELSSSSLAADLKLDYGVSDKLYFHFFGMYNFTRRTYDKIYLTSLSRYVEQDSLLYYAATANESNPHAEMGVQTMTARGGVEYLPNQESSYTLDVFFTQSMAQDMLANILNIALMERNISAFGLLAKGDVGQLKFTSSFFYNKDDMARAYNGYMYKSSRFLNTVGYQIKKQKLLVNPFINFNYLKVAPNDNIADVKFNPYLDIAAAVKGQYLFSDKLHLNFSLKTNLYALHNKVGLSGNVSAGYQWNKHTNLYATVGRAQNMAELLRYDEGYQLETSRSLLTFQNENKPKLITTDQISVGLKINPEGKLYINGELFGGYTKNTSYTVLNYQAIDKLSIDNATTDKAYLHSGARTQVLYAPGRLSLKAHAQYNYTKRSGSQGDYVNVFMPQFVAGHDLSYSLMLQRLNFTLNGYFYSGYNYIYKSKQYEISPKYISNVQVSYKLAKYAKIFLKVKNILNQAEPEYFFMDETPRLLLFGLRIHSDGF